MKFYFQSDHKIQVIEERDSSVVAGDCSDAKVLLNFISHKMPSQSCDVLPIFQYNIPHAAV